MEDYDLLLPAYSCDNVTQAPMAENDFRRDLWLWGLLAGILVAGWGLTALVGKDVCSIAVTAFRQGFLVNFCTCVLAAVLHFIGHHARHPVDVHPWCAWFLAFVVGNFGVAAVTVLYATRCGA
jgi:hypothetical protein